MNKTLIVTLHLEEGAQQYFNELRKEYFPAHINFLEAHLTLFHVLPAEEGIVQETLQQLSKRSSMLLSVTGPVNTGNGVAYKIVSEELQVLHAAMQEIFQTFLVGKDKLRLLPHITIQNKVTAFKAQVLFEKLSTGFTPFHISATGFCTFLYDDGPWLHLMDHLFEK